MPIKEIGAIVPTTDDAQQSFTFAICSPCAQRYRRWPRNTRQQQMTAAVGLLAMNPQRYMVKFFDSKEAAVLYSELEFKASKRE